MGEIVNVKSGFARNFLLPKKKALRATKYNINYFEKQKKTYSANNIKLKKEAETLANKIKEEVNLILIRHAGKNDQLYGSVTSKDISEIITKNGFSINRSQIILEKPIKNIGIHDIIINLHPEVETNIKINIARSKEELEDQETIKNTEN